MFQEEKCLYNFKSGADAQRHMILIHGKSGKEARPMGYSCNFLISGIKCNMNFETQWFLRKHRMQESHFVPRNKNDEPEPL